MYLISCTKYQPVSYTHLTKFVLTVGKNKDKRDRVIKIEFKAFRGINPEDGSDNTFTMFTFYIKQPFQ